MQTAYCKLSTDFQPDSDKSTTHFQLVIPELPSQMKFHRKVSLINAQTKRNFLQSNFIYPKTTRNFPPLNYNYKLSTSINRAMS